MMRAAGTAFLVSVCLSTWSDGAPVTQISGDIAAISLDSLLNIRVVAAAKYDRIMNEAPASISIITSADIERFGYRTLDEVLNSLRGFYIRNDHNYVHLGVRGFSRPGDNDNRILLLVNGHTLNENFYGSPPLGTDLGIDLRIVDRVEVIRGPSSALYGTGAMFGVVNIVTKSGKAFDGATISGSSGSRGLTEGIASYGKSFSNGVDLLVSGLLGIDQGQDLYFEEFDDSVTNHGVAEHIDDDRYGNVYAEMSSRGFTLSGFAARREKGIPTGAWETEFNNDDHRTVDERQFLELAYSRKMSQCKDLRARLYLDHYVFEGTYPYEDEELWGDASDGLWLGGELQLNWDLRTDNRLSVGAEYQEHARAKYRLWDQERIYFEDDFPFTVLSVYAEDTYQLMPSLGLTMGLRFDDRSDVPSSTTPRGAVILNLSSASTVKALYAEAFRAPNAYELYVESPDEAKSNPDLSPERIRTAEITWEHRLADAVFGVLSLYRFEADDLIDQVIDPIDTLAQFRNLSEVEAVGMEIEVDIRLESGLAGYARYSYQNAEDASTGQRLSNSPDHLLKAGIAVPLLGHYVVATEVLYETERLTIWETETEPVFLTKLNLSSTRLSGRLGLSVGIRNLFDVEYTQPGGIEHPQAALPQFGRRFTFTVSLGF